MFKHSQWPLQLTDRQFYKLTNKSDGQHLHVPITNRPRVFVNFLVNFC
jgi:hypothetical protein